MRSVVYICTLLLLVCARPGNADERSGSDSQPTACQRTTAGIEEVTPSEPTGVGAGIVLDEHLLTNGSRDQDYNGGGEFTFSGEHTGPIGHVLDRVLGFVDEKTCPASRFAAPGWQLGHAFALGLIVFTPRNLTAHDVVTGDRPYASLFFLSAGRRYVSADTEVAYNSSLTVGMMGLAAAGSV